MIFHTQVYDHVHLVCEQVKDFYGAVVGFWIPLGSRDEDPSENGVSHFFEHIVFKGTSNRTGFEIVHGVESVGGYINAYTTREHICIYAKVPVIHLQTAIELLADMYYNSLLTGYTLEKKVILEELRGYQDSPEDNVQEQFSAAIWGNSGLGMPIAGTLASVRKIKKANIEDFYQRVHHSPLVISVCGNVVQADVLDVLQKHFKAKQVTIPMNKTYDQQVCSTNKIIRKDVQQYHCAIGTTWSAHCEKDKLISQIISQLLGEGMSSLLFQRVREQKGLAYQVYSSVENFADYDELMIYFSGDYAGYNDAKQEIKNIFNYILENRLDAEWEKARLAVCGSLSLQQDSLTQRMSRLARLVMLGHKPEGFSSALDLINQITVDDLRQKAESIFQLHNNNWAQAMVLPNNIKRFSGFIV
jgi:predicted Zn-dependent peptidase